MDMEIEEHLGYKIDRERRVGFGSQGVVYMCKDTKNNRDICVWVQNLNPYNIVDQRQQQIFNLLKDLNNQNIVKMYDFRVEESYSYLYMEYCEPGNIKQLLQNAVLSPQEILNFVKQFVNGYNELYIRNIIHRNLKPSNILLQKDKYKITVSGISRTIDETDSFTNGIGTYLYWPPEKEDIGDAVIHSNKSDMYSLGVIIYEMLTNRQRQHGQSIQRFIQQINQEYQQFQEQQINDILRTEIWYLINSLVKSQLDERMDFSQLKVRVETTNIYNTLDTLQL